MGCTGHIYTGWASMETPLNPREPSAIHLLWSAVTSVPFSEPLLKVQLVSGSCSSPRGSAWSTGSVQCCTPAWCVVPKGLQSFFLLCDPVCREYPMLIAGAEETRSLQLPKLEARSLILLRNVGDVPTVLLLPIFHPPETFQKIQSCLHHFHDVLSSL